VRTDVARGAGAFAPRLPLANWKTQTFVPDCALTAPWVIDAPMDRTIFEVYVRTQFVQTAQEGNIVKPRSNKPSESGALGCCFCISPALPPPISIPSKFAQRNAQPIPKSQAMDSNDPPML
jgi:hypothetical protein